MHARPAGISRAAAEQLLQAAPPGAYLVRDSSREDADFSLSWQTGNGLGHLQITRLPCGPAGAGAWG